jgi:hypothetical protein
MHTEYRLRLADTTLRLRDHLNRTCRPSTDLGSVSSFNLAELAAFALRVETIVTIDRGSLPNLSKRRNAQKQAACLPYLTLPSTPSLPR